MGYTVTFVDRYPDSTTGSRGGNAWRFKVIEGAKTLYIAGYLQVNNKSTAQREVDAAYEICSALPAREQAAWYFRNNWYTGSVKEQIDLKAVYKNKKFARAHKRTL